MESHAKKPRVETVLAFLAILLGCETVRSNAAQHHCIEGAVNSIRMRGENDAKEILLTNIRNKDRYQASQLCSWEVLMTHMAVPQHILLVSRMRPMTGGSASKDGAITNSSKCNSTLYLNVTLENPGRPSKIFRSEFGGHQNMSDIMMVLPITERSHLFLATFSTGSEQPSANCKRIELVLSSVVKGYCDRYMLLHKTKCHFVSDTELRVDQWNQTGLALTGFSNIDEMRHLLKDNDRRLREHPYARPLNLSSPVRVGVFRCPKSEHAVYWKSENGNCKLETANFSGLTDANSSDSSSLQCLSFRILSNGELSLQFSDCRQPMRSLLNFAESPQQSEAWCPSLPLCEAEEINQIEMNESRPTQSVQTDTPNTKIKTQDVHYTYFDIKIGLGIIFIIILVLGAIIFIFMCWRPSCSLQIMYTAWTTAATAATAATASAASAAGANKDDSRCALINTPAVSNSDVRANAAYISTSERN